MITKNFNWKHLKNDTYYDFIKELICNEKSKIIAEIGVERGKMARFILRSEAQEFIEQYWAIDSWATSIQWENHTQEDWENIYRDFCKYYPWFPALKIFRMPSVEASAYFSKNFKGYFDFVFIDACHTYESVKKDIKAWYPLVKKGSLLTGHDYCSHFPGVKKAVDEIFGSDKEVEYEVWMHRKS